MISPFKIAESMPRDKSAYDKLGNPLAFFFARPISFPVTSLLLAIGFTARSTSLLSLLFALFACVAAAEQSYMVSFFLILAWLILDCADGNIARFTKTGSKSGEFLDAISGYVVFSGFYVCLGFSTGNINACFAGGLASIACVLSRLLLNKHYNLSSKVRRDSGDVSDGSLMKQLLLSVYNLTGIGFALAAIAVFAGYIMEFLVFQSLVGFVVTLGVSVQADRSLRESTGPSV